ncbi:hypothetical protein K435DRAFT_849844 [Dendrothele bispora CBS 962.96]|uniref:Uncharacterized protein n=1 Tax=Dendrothele bispora (strain CBS 962.96) TaxID=1314807 RepID=A0A4S8MRM7_DENBC|nr:hypothetical protein K435DRAFT_849844 [Dendrothele bispora CBS 962.96]
MVILRLMGYEAMPSQTDDPVDGMTLEGDKGRDTDGKVEEISQEHKNGTEGVEDDGSGAMSVLSPIVINIQPDPPDTNPQHSPKPTTIQMPSLATDLNIQLHSPSTHIIGTPFQVSDASPFEYPFPSQSSSSSSSSSSSRTSLRPSTTSSDSLPSLSTSFSTPNLSSSYAYGSPIPRSTSPQLLPTYLPTMTSFPQLPLPPLSSSNSRSYSPTHPKLRTVEPPVPPTLAKKSQRWSMGLMTRRKRGGGGIGSSEDDDNPVIPTDCEPPARRYSVDVPYGANTSSTSQSPNTHGRPLPPPPPASVHSTAQ